MEIQQVTHSWQLEAVFSCEETERLGTNRSCMPGVYVVLTL